MPGRAYLFASAAIALWSTLASLIWLLRGIDLFLIAGVTLIGGGLLSAHRWREWKVPTAAKLVGVGGLFGYHALFFWALRVDGGRAAVAANLLDYLWPLLIVLLAPLVLPRRAPLALRHWLGAALGFAGTVLIVAGDGVRPQASHLVAYAAATAAAVVWALYSLLCQRLQVPTVAVGGFCIVSGACALAVHLLGGGDLASLRALDWAGWLALAGLAVGPMGLAFFAWDAALKEGDVRVIGALSYLTPLLSTLLLVLTTGQPFRWTMLLAMALIIGGAAVAALGPGARDATRRTTGRITRGGTGRTTRTLR